MTLLDPIRIGSLDLPNRIVMAPLTRRRAGAGKKPTELMALYYRQRAGAGLIISESTEIDPRSDGTPPTRPGLYDEAQAAAWRIVTDGVHQAGGRIFVQLSHLGRAAHPLLLTDGGTPVGPSAIAGTGTVFTREGPKPYVVPRALELDEIPGIIGQFATAARFAIDAGFDGVEIHGANGYLIDEFLRDGSNHRTDRYGGSAENRARLLVEIVEAIGAVWGTDRIGVRLSPLGSFQGMSDSNPRRTFSTITRLLDRFDLAYLHVVESVKLSEEELKAGGPVASELRELFHGAFILAGGYDRISAGTALATGAADLVAFGEAFIANPDLPERFRRAAYLNPPDRSTYYGGGAKGYVDYPALDAPL